jgi:DNA invertase Pin-like site-specific DNA recombinase
MDGAAQLPDECADEPRRVGLYLRVSTDAQTERFGLAVQRLKLYALARRHRWHVVREYVDAGISGAAGPKERPALSQLLKAVQRGAVAAVLVASLDRLARTTRLTLELVEQFRSHGVDLLSCTEQFDVRTSAGLYQLTLLAARVQLDYETTRARTSDGRNERSRRDGEQGGNLPLGYCRHQGRVVIDPVGAATVRRIFGLKRAGASLPAIAAILNDSGMPTGKGGMQWYPSSVRQVLLQKAVYYGGRRGRSHWHWPPILGKHALHLSVDL